MERKQVYTVIAVIIGLILLYSLGTHVYYLLKSSFYFGIISSLSYFPVVLGLTGIIIFLASGFRRSGLFRLYLCFEIFAIPFTVWFYISYLTRDNSFGDSDPNFNFSLLLGMFLTLVIAVCSVTGLWLLSKEQVAKIIYVKTGVEMAGHFEPARHGKRIANRIIDASTILFVIYQHVLSNSFSSADIRVNSYWGLMLIEIPAIIVYYLLLEGIFNTSAGKCATGTIIVNEYGSRPGFAQILGRTFSRIIPFDALSFLGSSARGWHDTLSSTYVVDAIHRDDIAQHEITLDAELNQPAV